MKTRTNKFGEYDDSFKRQIVSEIESGLSIYSCGKKYCISRITIKRWLVIFGSMKTKEQPVTSPVFSSMEEENAYLRTQLKASEKACHYASLKAKALDMMIDIAEEKLKVPIRKKPGTKQS